MIATLTSCNGAAQRADASKGEIRILSMDGAPTLTQGLAESDTAEARTCSQWRLSEAQAIEFFRLSKEYTDGLPHEFNTLQCAIKGTLQADGEQWDFEINAGAHATWRRGDTFRTWGCADPACAPLAALMPDDGSE